MRSDATFASANGARAEEAHRQHRRRRPQLPGDERGDEERAEHERARRSPGCAQPCAVAAHEAPDDPEETGARKADPGEVEPAAGPVALLEPAQRERDEDEADRDVEPEDPLPRDPLDDRAADERAERDREAADAAPGAEREPAPLGRAPRR